MSISSQEIHFISKLLKEVQYGSISITLNDGKIVQIESMKKKRFDKKNRSNRNINRGY
ncbi:YezD family protein [Peribacillus asahii]|uniref:YezD family protein n=1 Tax=Peribacillus asahii TaxID=228899 RepID=UPI00207A638F|nr:YezD family protein [Peribacillus asahii]USK58417.1 YezD family protein [Peribacillus asahii]